MPPTRFGNNVMPSEHTHTHLSVFQPESISMLGSGKGKTQKRADLKSKTAYFATELILA